MFTDEIRLIERAQCGEQDALVDVYECCQPSVFTYVYYRVGDRETAEDLTDVLVILMIGSFMTVNAA